MRPGIANRGRATLLLLALCIGITTVIYLEVNDAAPDLPVNAPTAATRNTAKNDGGEPSFSMPPLGGYSDVLLRPLFSSTRRPARDAAAVVPSSGFRLVGIVRSAHESHALIEHGPHRLDRVAEEQELDGWTVETILDDRVILRHADVRLEVKEKDTPPNPAQINLVQPSPSPPSPGSPVATATSGIQSGPQTPPPR